MKNKSNDFLSSFIKDLTEATEKIDNLQKDENLTEEEKKKQAEDLMKAMQPRQKALAELLTVFRKRQIKKEKISKFHLEQLVLGYKKIILKEIGAKQNSSVDGITESIYANLDTLYTMEDQDRSISLRNMISTSLKNLKGSFVEAIDEARSLCQSNEEFIEDTLEYYRSFFDLVFKVSDEKWQKRQEEVQKALDETKEKHEKALAEEKEKANAPSTECNDLPN